MNCQKCHNPLPGRSKKKRHCRPCWLSLTKKPARKCQNCDNPVRGHSKQSKLCWDCAVAPKTSRAQVCPDCGGPRYKTYGRCRPCFVAYNGRKKCQDCDNLRGDSGNPRCKSCRNLFVKNNKKYLANCKLRTRYGISMQEAEKILVAQGNKCAACEGDFKGTSDTHLDHDHETGNIRGILCRGCNMALGTVKDSTARLRKLIEYLEAYESSETTRLAPSLKGDDIVRPLWRHRERGRNARVTSEAMLWV